MAVVITAEFPAFTMLVMSLGAMEVGSPLSMARIGALMMISRHLMSEEDSVASFILGRMARRMIDMLGILVHYDMGRGLMVCHGCVTGGIMVRRCSLSACVEGEGHADCSQAHR